MWRLPGGAIGGFVSHGEGVRQNPCQDYPNLGDIEWVREILISQRNAFQFGWHRWHLAEFLEEAFTNPNKCQSLSVSPGDKEGGLLFLVLLLLLHLPLTQQGLLLPPKHRLCLSVVPLGQEVFLLPLSFKGRDILIINPKPAPRK